MNEMNVEWNKICSPPCCPHTAVLVCELCAQATVSFCHFWQCLCCGSSCSGWAPASLGGPVREEHVGGWAWALWGGESDPVNAWLANPNERGQGKGGEVNFGFNVCEPRRYVIL